MTGLPRARLALLPGVMLLMGGFAGCTTTADVTYSEYRFGPGFGTERTYESRVYGDSTRGLGSESCRTVVRSDFDWFGEASRREVTTCDEP